VLAKEQPPFAVETVPDTVLAEQRGGFRLPSGIEVTLAIDTLTAVNGAIVLHTVTKIAPGSPITSVYVPEHGETVPLAEGRGLEQADAQPSVTYDRQYGLQVLSRGASAPMHVSITNDQAGGSKPAGLQQVDPAAAVSVAGGVVQALTGEGLQGIEFQGPDIRILHLTGSAFGSVITNSGSDRTIETQTSLSIDLRNAGPDVLGSAMLRVEGLAVEALGARF
jgi:hypothetical protein